MSERGEAAVAVETVYPEAGELVCEGPVGCTDEVSNDDFRYLDIGLPPEIARLKAAGHLTEASDACTRLLEAGCERELAACLRAERHRMGRLAEDFCVPRAAAIAQIRREWPDFTEQAFDDLIARGRIDWRYVDGELCVLGNFLDSLRVYPAEVPGLAPETPLDTATRDRMLAAMLAEGAAEREITLRASLEVPAALPGETVRAWLPLPAACALQGDIEVLDATPGVRIAPATAPARTAFWESDTHRSFTVTYRYRARAPYVDAWAGDAQQTERIGSDPAPVPEDLAELRPHIAFTPYLRALAASLVEGIDRPLDRARAIYDYVTRHIDYRYQPAYAQLDAIADSCVKSQRADCGIFALTFITLCRIAGVPARWESGLYVACDHVGPHDWARFYTPETGWLWADCSFGSSARRAGDEERRRHHFGNLDPWRMVANRAFQAELDPPVDGVRWDPYDNQMGEASVDGRGLDVREMHRAVELVEMREV